MDDNTLAKKAQKDPEYFGALYDRFAEKIYRYHFFRLRDRDDAEDLTAETFEKILRNISRFKDRGLPFTAWMFRIAHNSLVDFLRRKKQPPLSLDMLSEEGKEPSESFSNKNLEMDISPEKLWEAIHSLPEKQQQIWGLKLSKDLSHKEIAHILDITPTHVNVLIHRSVQRLKTSLLPPSRQK